MPELPEVNTVRIGFHQAVVGKPILKVVVHDDKILRNCNGQQFCRSLQKRTFVDTYRQGKYFFGGLDDGKSVLFHLGMTGDVIYHSDPEEKSRHERFRIEFADDIYLSFDDPRKFARILVLDDREKYIEEIRLGPDALLISKSEFEAIFRKRSTTLKGLLLNQNLIAGIGNLYADEICYQTRLHPASIAGLLSKRQIDSLFTKMKAILQLAVDRDAYYKIYPDDWFWKWRDLSAKPPGGKGKICRAKVAGRTTYWVEGRQKLIGEK